MSVPRFGPESVKKQREILHAESRVAFEACLRLRAELDTLVHDIGVYEDVLWDKQKISAVPARQDEIDRWTIQQQLCVKWRDKLARMTPTDTYTDLYSLHSDVTHFFKVVREELEKSVKRTKQDSSS